MKCCPTGARGHRKYREPQKAGLCHQRWTIWIVVTCFMMAIPQCVMANSMDRRAESDSSRPRARDLGIVIGTFSPGTMNAITDVPGVKVGHATLIEGDGPLKPGQGRSEEHTSELQSH